ncbi:MAG: NAD-dependent epimerase/dehydratase family protein [Novosphingobium sp.]|nr:NAD-dependent epimerase/dehydratase family protein [Novosphingobium sp.]
MDVLVFGATGYLGSHVTRCLASAGMRVSGVSRSAAGDAKVEAAGGVPLRGDLSDPAPLIEAAAEHDAVVYAAQLDMQDEFDFLSALTGCLAGGNKSLVFTSGTGILSQRTDGEWSEDTFTEYDHFVPSKYIGFRCVTENLVMAAGWTGGSRAMVVRPSMIWGNGGCGHIARFYKDAWDHGEVGYLSRGLNLYSHVHVEDLAELFRLALERGVGGALYHAVAGEENNRSIAHAVAADAGVPVRSLAFDEAVERWGKFYTLIGMGVCSRSRAPRSRTELGWLPRHVDLMDDIGHPNYGKPGA